MKNSKTASAIVATAITLALCEGTSARANGVDNPFGGDDASYGGASYGGASYGGASYGGASYGGASYGGASYGGFVEPALRLPDKPVPVISSWKLSTSGNRDTVRATVVLAQSAGVQVVRLTGRIGDVQTTGEQSDELFAVDETGKLHAMHMKYKHVTRSIQFGEATALAGGEALAFGRAPATSGDPSSNTDTAAVVRVRRNATLAWHAAFTVQAPATCNPKVYMCGFAFVEAAVATDAHVFALVGYQRGTLQAGAHTVRGKYAFNRALIQLDLASGKVRAAIELGNVFEKVLASNGVDVCTLGILQDEATTHLMCYGAQKLNAKRPVKLAVKLTGIGMTKRLLFAGNKLVVVAGTPTGGHLTMFAPTGTLVGQAALGSNALVVPLKTGVLSVAPKGNARGQDAIATQWDTLQMAFDGSVRRGVEPSAPFLVESVRLDRTDAGITMSGVLQSAKAAPVLAVVAWDAR